MPRTCKYDYQKVEVCRNCLGVGTVKPDDEPTSIECPVCGGSGRVLKSTHIEITISPYLPAEAK